MKILIVLAEFEFQETNKRKLIVKLITGGEVQLVLVVGVASLLDPKLSNVIAATGSLMLRNYVFP